MQTSVTRLVAALAAGPDVQLTVIAPASGEEPSARARPEASVEVIRVRTPARLTLLDGFRVFRRNVQSALLRLDPEIVHGQGLLAEGLAAVDASRVPRIVTAHGNARQDALAAYRGLGGRSRATVSALYARSVVRRADAVIGVHPNWKFSTTTRPARFVHIPNIVDERFFATPREPEGGLVLYCGGPRVIKGWDILAAAWLTVASSGVGARLEIVGWDAPPPEPLAEIDSVTVRGRVDVDELRACMARASLLVIPSRYEVAPVVLGEAWAARLPVVAAAVGGIATMAQGAAVLVPSALPAELAAAILASLHGGFDHRLVDAGRARAERSRASEVAAAHLALYSELVAGG